MIARAEGRLPDGSPLWEILDAIKRLDRERADGRPRRGAAGNGHRTFTNDVIAPLADAIGDLWVLGRLSVAAEHLASEVVVQLLKAELSGRFAARSVDSLGLSSRRAARVGASRAACRLSRSRLESPVPWYGPPTSRPDRRSVDHHAGVHRVERIGPGER